MKESKDKREGFNFYRSYFDVYKELVTDKEKAQFMDALLCRQFEGIEPENLTGMARFAYVSQQYNIDRQVKGWEDKKGVKLTPTDGGVNTPNQQVQEEEEVKVQGEVQLKEKKENNSILLCSLFSKDELFDRTDRATFSFWQLFKSNLQESGINKTTNLDKATLEKWRIPIKFMLEKDGRTVEEFEEVFKFLKTNAFWKKNIQSTVKLREKFERLLVEARTKPEAKVKNQMDPEYLARLNAKLNS